MVEDEVFLRVIVPLKPEPQSLPITSVTRPGAPVLVTGVLAAGLVMVLLACAVPTVALAGLDNRRPNDTVDPAVPAWVATRTALEVSPAAKVTVPVAAS